MAKLRTRKWGCALGITLLIAVPVALAVWLGQMLMKPRTVDEVLRAIPLYPGARDAQYDSAPGPPQPYSRHDWASVKYSVDVEARRVLSFCDDTLRRDHWEGLPQEGDFFWLGRAEYPFESIWFGGPAPWVHARQGYVFYRASVSAENRRSNGRRWAQVSVSVSQYPPPAP